MTMPDAVRTSAEDLDFCTVHNSYEFEKSAITCVWATTHEPVMESCLWGKHPHYDPIWDED